MSEPEKTPTRQVGLRMEEPLYERVVERQQELKRQTGIEPTITDVIRLLIERGLDAPNGKKR